MDRDESMLSALAFPFLQKSRPRSLGIRVSERLGTSANPIEPQFSLNLRRAAQFYDSDGYGDLGPCFLRWRIRQSSEVFGWWTIQYPNFLDANGSP